MIAIMPGWGVVTHTADIWQDKGNQNLRADVIVTDEESERPATYRIKVRRNAYDTQSSGVVEVLTKNGWTEVISKRLSDTPIAPYSYTQKVEVWEMAMIETVEQLLILARQIWAYAPR